MASSFKHTCSSFPSSILWNSLHEIYYVVECLVCAIGTRIYITKLLQQGTIHRWENPSRRVCSFTPESKIPGRGKIIRLNKHNTSKGEWYCNSWQTLQSHEHCWIVSLKLQNNQATHITWKGFGHHHHSKTPPNVRGSRISWTYDLETCLPFLSCSFWNQF